MTKAIDQPLVLVADDDEEFREDLIPRALRRLHARTLPAKDVLEACLAAAKHDSHSDDPLNVIVLDMHMPLHENTTKIANDGGIQFLRSNQLTACPIVVFTAYPNFRDCVRAVQAGAAAYLSKSEPEAGEEPEGGINDLVETCRRLLTRPEADQMRSPPNGNWADENYDWLRQKCGGRWVAFVAASEASAAGISGTPLAGQVVISENSREDLARLVAKKLPFLSQIPHIAYIPTLEVGEGNA